MANLERRTTKKHRRIDPVIGAYAVITAMSAVFLANHLLRDGLPTNQIPAGIELQKPDINTIDLQNLCRKIRPCMTV